MVRGACKRLGETAPAKPARRSNSLLYAAASEFKRRLTVAHAPLKHDVRPRHRHTVAERVRAPDSLMICRTLAPDFPMMAPTTDLGTVKIKGSGSAGRGRVSARGSTGGQ
eukprot:1049979-Pleurochrysis_carterae.AAC.1